MPSDFISNLFVFILAGFVGFEVIKRVSPLLHTPLMSLTNALDAIVVVAAIIIAGRHETTLSTVLGVIAVAASFSNMVGGFLITDRMLRMFKTGQSEKIMSAADVQQLIDFTYIVAAVLFVLSLKWLSSPVTARHGVLAGEIGAALAVGATLFNPELVQYKWIVIALIIGAGIGIPLGMVHMTAVPQRTALSHAFGALSATMIGIAEYYVRVPHVTQVRHGGNRARSDHRLADLHRQRDRRRQTAGNSAAAADHLSRAEHRQPLGAGRGAACWP